MRAAAPPTAQISVRRFAPEDAAFVATLSQQAFAEYGAQPARYTSSVIQRPDTRTWVAVEGDRPVGMVLLELSAQRAAVLAVAVTERARGRGVGNLLMQAAEQHARAQGARQISLCTADANLAALDLFLRRGFQIVRRKPGFYSRRQDACELEKTLTAQTSR